MESSSRPRSTSPAGASPSSTPPYRAVVSEDSDDYVDNQNQNKHQEASTSTAISLGADTEGLRERNRAPYSASTVPKREEVSPASTAPEQVPSSSYSSTASDKGKQKAKDEADGQDTSSNENPFACHICLEVPAADDAVLSKCGHLFCWSDLSAWLESNPPATSQCPVCKSQIKDIQEDVIPIYSGGGTSGKKQIDPRTKPRPKPRVQPAPASTTTTGGSLGWLNNGGLFGPFWDLSGPGTAMGLSGLPIYPGMTLGWSSGPRPVHLAGPRGMTVGYAGVPQPGAPLSPEQQELARRQQRNALIAFIVMIVIFSILATLGEMQDGYY